MNARAIVAGVIAAALVAGCATRPEGPEIPARPGEGKSWEAFQHDDYVCRDFADGRVAGRAENANDHAILTTIIGAGLGAALGGAIGGGNGAGIGAAAGGVGGAAYGSNQTDRSQYSMQRQYDIAYGQCMAAKGNDVPPPFGYRHRRDRDDRYDNRDRYDDRDRSDRGDYRDDGPPPRD
jgi:uncharacterized protein YcfJ